MFKKYVFVKQHDESDCGAACIATIAKHYGLILSIAKIRELAGTDKKGTSLFGLAKASRELGFTSKGVEGTAEDLHSDFPLPCIAHVIKEGNVHHYLVIHKIKKKLIIADPASGIEQITFDEFLSIWSGALLIIEPDLGFRVNKENKENKTTLARFIYILKPQKKLLINIFFASFTITFLGIVSAFFFKYLLDDILPNSLINTLNAFSIGIILLYLIRAVLGALRSHLLLYLSQNLNIPMILNYYSHVINLPLKFFSTRKTGEIISRFTDSVRIRKAISNATLTVMMDSLLVIAGAIVLYIQSPTLFVISLVNALLYALIVFLFKRPIRKINRQQMENSENFTSYMVESIKGVETIKANTSEKIAYQNTESKYLEVIKSIFKGGKINILQRSIIGFISAAGGAIILWVGALSIINGNMTLGQLITFNALLVYFLGPLKNIIGLQSMLQSAIVAAERLTEILDLETENEKMQNLTEIENLNGVIEINNIDFRYGSRELTLKNISLYISQGEKVALVGKSGAGKTTLAKLLLNFYQSEKGEITINEINIQDIALDFLRKKIAYISQETFLFSGTIYENLTLGNKNISLSEVVKVAKKVKAHNFINKLPERYNYIVEENGSNLSGGQKQRLAIARAMINKPDIFIFDEGTSNLDYITEKAIENTIVESMKDKTVIIIAHRMSTIKICDRVYLIEEGKILEYGTNEELMNRKGKYFEMFK